jgi:hypothetical protein
MTHKPRSAYYTCNPGKELGKAVLGITATACLIAGGLLLLSSLPGQQTPNPGYVGPGLGAAENTL